MAVLVDLLLVHTSLQAPLFTVQSLVKNLKFLRKPDADLALAAYTETSWNIFASLLTVLYAKRSFTKNEKRK